MLIKLRNIFTIIVVVSVMLLPILKVPAKAAGNVSITLSPASGSIGATDQTIYVNIDTAGTGISAVSLYLTYDPAVLSLTAEQGTISDFVSSGLFAGDDNPAVSGVDHIQQGTVSTTGYTGSGILAVIKVKTLNSSITVQDTQLTIRNDSKVLTPTDANTNQMATASLGSSFTYTADPSYVATSLPTTAIFDDNRVALAFEIILGMTLIFLGIRAIRIKTKNINN